MIIWSRWGVLVLVTLGLGTGTGALLNLALDPGVTSGPRYGLFVGVGLVMAGAYTYLLDSFVIARHLDQPRQQFLLQPLPQPHGHPDGVRQTHQQVAVLHPDTGQPLVDRPRSSFFFVPVAAWPYVFAAIGVAVTIGCTIVTLAG